jgi:hypothetical protein
LELASHRRQDVLVTSERYHPSEIVERRRHSCPLSEPSEPPLRTIHLSTSDQRDWYGLDADEPLPAINRFSTRIILGQTVHSK